MKSGFDPATEGILAARAEMRDRMSEAWGREWNRFLDRSSDMSLDARLAFSVAGAIGSFLEREIDDEAMMVGGSVVTGPSGVSIALPDGRAVWVTVEVSPAP